MVARFCGHCHSGVFTEVNSMGIECCFKQTAYYGLLVIRQRPWLSDNLGIIKNISPDNYMKYFHDAPARLTIRFSGHCIPPWLYQV
jgi:hypothetical protein